ncbi:hypothetical protein TNCV_3907821 [Trichonephila clavipes]|nr:hypothetical protein TNCV_3907821 [Trichonephila clavipes]
MVPNATANDRLHLALYHDDFRGPCSGSCRSGISRFGMEKYFLLSYSIIDCLVSILPKIAFNRLLTALSVNLDSSVKSTEACFFAPVVSNNSVILSNRNRRITIVGTEKIRTVLRFSDRRISRFGMEKYFLLSYSIIDCLVSILPKIAFNRLLTALSVNLDSSVKSTEACFFAPVVSNNSVILSNRNRRITIVGTEKIRTVLRFSDRNSLSIGVTKVTTIDAQQSYTKHTHGVVKV